MSDIHCCCQHLRKSLSDLWCLILMFKEERINLRRCCFFSRSFMECCERFAVLGFNLAWPSLLCCLKDKSSPLFIFSCFKKQPVQLAELGRLRGSLQFWHFNLRVIGAWSGSQYLTLSETLSTQYASFSRPEVPHRDSIYWQWNPISG